VIHVKSTFKFQNSLVVEFAIKYDIADFSHKPQGCSHIQYTAC